MWIYNRARLCVMSMCLLMPCDDEQAAAHVQLLSVLIRAAQRAASGEVNLLLLLLSDRFLTEWCGQVRRPAGYARRHRRVTTNGAGATDSSSASSSSNSVNTRRDSTQRTLQRVSTANFLFYCCVHSFVVSGARRGGHSSTTSQIGCVAGGCQGRSHCRQESQETRRSQRKENAKETCSKRFEIK